MRFIPGCGCCSSCADCAINAVAKCGGTGSALTSVTFDLRDAADTTTIATQNGSSASFTGLDGSLSYKVRVTKTGYHTKTSSTITPGCGGTSSVTVSTWPETYSFKTTVRILGIGTPCYMNGASVSYTGDDSQIGVTSGVGEITLVFSSTSTSITQSLNYTITPASGSGADTITGSITINACSPSDQTFTLPPDSTHVAVVCNRKYMPETLNWSDQYGSCTLTWFSGWYGSYSYSSSHGFMNSGLACNTTVTVPVDCLVAPSEDSCTSTTFFMSRHIDHVGCGTICRPVDDPNSPNNLVSLLGLETVISGGANSTVSCSNSISFSATEDGNNYGFIPTGCTSYTEIDAVITITGTI